MTPGSGEGKRLCRFHRGGRPAKRSSALFGLAKGPLRKAIFELNLAGAGQVRNARFRLANAINQDQHFSEGVEKEEATGCLLAGTLNKKSRGWDCSDCRPEGPLVNSHAREGVDWIRNARRSAEGAAVEPRFTFSQNVWTVAPSALDQVVGFLPTTSRAWLFTDGPSGLTAEYPHHPSSQG